MSTIHDPVPVPLSGNAATVHAKALVMTATADALRTAISELRSLSSDTVTISEAVDELRDKADGVRGDIDKVETRYRGAADAMSSYHTGLGNAQARADRARQRITDNNSDAAYWRRHEEDLKQRVLSGESSQELLDELKDVQRRVEGYADEFLAAMEEYHAAEGDKRDAAAAAVNALQNAADAANLDDGFWDRVGAVVEVMYEWAQENLGPFIEKLRAVLEIIKGIIDILALIVGVLSLFLPFLAPLATALTLVSVGLAAAILLCSLVLFALGRESLGRVLSDAIGLATSVITSKMGGTNLFKPAEKLAGLSQVVKPSVWSSGMQMARFEFAFTRAVVGTGETVGIYGMEIAGKLFPPGRTLVKLGSGIGAGFVSGGLDVNFDLFPENGGGAFQGGWDVSGEDATKAVFKPIANTLSGGFGNPSIAIATGVQTLTAGAS
jgi:hypothetical protein